MKVSTAGLDLIKKHEGLRLTAYPDPATGGEPWTIGYGVTSRAGVGKVTKGMKITQQEAEDMLRRALAVFERGVQDSLTRQPTQHQFDSMVSFAYNVGLTNFRRSSVLRLFNEGKPQAAAEALLKWNKANGKVMSGLTKRRADERAWFLRQSEPVAQQKPAPAPKPPASPVEPVPPPPAPIPPPAPETPPVPPAPTPNAGRSVAAILLGAAATLIAAFAAWIMKG